MMSSVDVDNEAVLLFAIAMKVVAGWPFFWLSRVN